MAIAIDMSAHCVYPCTPYARRFAIHSQSFASVFPRRRGTPVILEPGDVRRIAEEAAQVAAGHARKTNFASEKYHLGRSCWRAMSRPSTPTEVSAPSRPRVRTGRAR
jgi:hypothetical protein